MMTTNTVRSFERKNNPLYADPRGYRIATMAKAIDSYQSMTRRLYGAVLGLVATIFVLSIFAVPTVINLLTH